MGDDSNRSKLTKLDKLRTWAAIAGMTALGPVFMTYVIVIMFRGELSGRLSTLNSADHPILFYAVICIFLLGSLKLTQISALFAVGYIRSRSRR